MSQGVIPPGSIDGQGGENDDRVPHQEKLNEDVEVGGSLLQPLPTTFSRGILLSLVRVVRTSLFYLLSFPLSRGRLGPLSWRGPFPWAALMGKGVSLLDVDLAYTSIVHPLGVFVAPLKGVLSQILCPIWGPFCLVVAVVLRRLEVMYPLPLPLLKVKSLPKWLTD